jgi:hypothetical protein
MSLLTLNDLRIVILKLERSCLKRNGEGTYENQSSHWNSMYGRFFFLLPTKITITILPRKLSQKQRHWRIPEIIISRHRWCWSLDRVSPPLSVGDKSTRRFGGCCLLYFLSTAWRELNAVAEVFECTPDACRDKEEQNDVTLPYHDILYSRGLLTKDQIGSWTLTVSNSNGPDWAVHISSEDWYILKNIWLVLLPSRVQPGSQDLFNDTSVVS